MSKINFEMVLTGADPEKLQEPQYLRSLCQKEAARFEQYVQRVDPQFRDGLAKWELRAVEGYIYQKVKGHIDAFHNQHSDPMEKPDGEKTSL